MRLLAFLVALFVAFSVWQHVRLRQNEQHLALVATSLVGRDVGVSCPGFWTRLVEITPYGGWVRFDEHGRPEDEAGLAASTCDSLERLRRDDAPDFACLTAGVCGDAELRAVRGLVTLAHESWHLRGVQNEAQTQCYAVQTTEATARAFGLDAAAARRIAVWVAAEDARQSDWEYRNSAKCRPGGAWDLRPDTPAWPG